MDKIPDYLKGYKGKTAAEIIEELESGHRFKKRNEKRSRNNSSAASLPAALAPLVALEHWLIWRWEKTKTGKSTKVPYQAARPNKRANSTDPATWSDFATAAAAAAQANGIGFCLLDTEYGAFDIDNCRNKENGALVPWAQELVARAGSYTEVTISGTGLRIIGRANGPKIHRKQEVGNGVSVETYRKAERYIVMTGNVLPGTPAVLADLDALMEAVVAELGGAKQQQNQDSEATPLDETIAADDPRLAKLDPKWIALGHEGTGIAENYGGDRSQAVMAFACECLRTGIDKDVIATILMQWRIGEHIREQSNAPRSLKRVMERAELFVRDSELFKMNEDHCVLPIAGKTRVATWDDDPAFPCRKTIVRFSSLPDFKALQDKYRITYESTDKKGAPITVTTGRGTWWIGNAHRRQYDGGMRFMPTLDEDVVENTLNLWHGFGVPARKPEGKSGAAGCQLFLDHGLNVICSGNEEHFDYLMKREALIAQQRIRSEIAIGLRTEEEGTGKGAWCRGLNHLYGEHAMQVQNPEHVTGKHNAHLETLLRLTADEALFASDPRHRNALYNRITEPDLTIEPKFIGAYKAPNHLNIDVISNAKHFLPVSGTARRFMVPTVSSARANDHEYFRNLEAQLNDGGYEALLYHLLYEIDIRDFNVRAVPKTAALAEQASYSRKGVDLLVERACNEACVPCPVFEWPGFSNCTGYDRREGFDYFIDHHSDQELKRLGPLGVKRRLAKEWGCITGKATRRRKENEDHRVTGIEWLALSELRDRFVTKHGPQQWLCSESEWYVPENVIVVLSGADPAENK